jgi:hypothetical protein
MEIQYIMDIVNPARLDVYMLSCLDIWFLNRCGVRVLDLMESIEFTLERETWRKIHIILSKDFFSNGSGIFQTTPVYRHEGFHSTG